MIGGGIILKMITIDNESYCCDLFEKARKNNWIVIRQFSQYIEEGNIARKISYGIWIIERLFKNNDEPHGHNTLQIIKCPWCGNSLC